MFHTSHTPFIRDLGIEDFYWGKTGRERGSCGSMTAPTTHVRLNGRRHGDRVHNHVPQAQIPLRASFQRVGLAISRTLLRTRAADEGARGGWCSALRADLGAHLDRRAMGAELARSFDRCRVRHLVGPRADDATIAIDLINAPDDALPPVCVPDQEVLVPRIDGVAGEVLVSRHVFKSITPYRASLPEPRAIEGEPENTAREHVAWFDDNHPLSLPLFFLSLGWGVALAYVRDLNCVGVVHVGVVERETTVFAGGSFTTRTASTRSSRSPLSPLSSRGA